MPRGKGLKVQRKERNDVFQRRLKEAKKLRKKRREIYEDNARDRVERLITRQRRRDVEAAMAAAMKMKKSKKAGMADIDKNMIGLGFKRINDSGDLVYQFERLP